MGVVSQQFGSVVLLLLAAAAIGVVSGQELWKATPLTAANTFSSGIEGPAVDVNGNLYVQNFARQSTIGKIDTKTGKGAVFVDFGAGSVGNGMRIDAAGFGFVADYKTHTIWKVDLTKKTKTPWAQSNLMKQPNDVALGTDGTIWASDPNWSKGTGSVWRITAGKVVLAVDGLGTANGIDLSPDGNTLYVNAPGRIGGKDICRLYSFAIDPTTKALSGKTEKVLNGGGCDGMRVDVDGKLYITRNPGGVVNKINPADASIIQTIPVLGASPTNLAFGGVDGKTVFVTEAEKKRIVQFRVDSAGYEFSRLRKRAF